MQRRHFLFERKKVTGVIGYSTLLSTLWTGRTLLTNLHNDTPEDVFVDPLMKKEIFRNLDDIQEAFRMADDLTSI